jgi:hypothetical protein
LIDILLIDFSTIDRPPFVPKFIARFTYIGKNFSHLFFFGQLGSRMNEGEYGRLILHVFSGCLLLLRLYINKNSPFNIGEPKKYE